MNKILSDAVNYGREYLRMRSAAFFMFAFPIILVLVFGAVFSGGTTKVDVPVQNMDDGAYGIAFMQALNATGSVNIKMIPADANISQYIKDNSLSVAIEIPSNFSEGVMQSLASNDSHLADLTVYGDPSQSTFASIMGSVQAAETMLNYKLAGAKPILSLSVKSVASSSYEAMDYFLPGVVAITVMTNSMYGMTGVCAAYKSRGYAKLLATTTLTKGEWLSSKILIYTVLLTLSVLMTYGIGILALGLHVTLTPLTFALIPAGALLFTSAGMILGSVTKDAESASAIANALGFPMMFLSGSFFPLSMMPGFLQTAAQAIPMTYLTNGLRDTMLFGNNASTLFNLAVILGMGAVMFVAGSKLMSWKEK